MIPATKNKGPKACTTCAKAKSRCIAGPTAERCERYDGAAPFPPVLIGSARLDRS